MTSEALCFHLNVLRPCAIFLPFLPEKELKKLVKILNTEMGSHIYLIARNFRNERESVL